ncbi:MAG TPA: DNA integrity scanning protein DisA nucleotide-binding domain protein [Clostridia bacterium]|nr:DNA integrity scanning protein DisA nucleotide-binding domain protein [Clostridia bacterium]
MYNFLEYFKNIDLFALIDGAILITTVTLVVLFFAYKRNLRVVLISISLFVLAIVLNIISYMVDYEVLTISRAIVHYGIIFLVVATAIIYQTDLRSMAQKISNPRGVDLYSEGYGSDDELRDTTTEILTACQNMAKQDIGAIIVITGTSEFPVSILETGTNLGASLSSGLIESIFNTKSPLHDGAVVVKGNRILAAGCFLPLTQKSISKDMGTRHRAAVGISEESDVLSIVISEETGIISSVRDGDIKRYMTMEKLKDEIEESFGISASALAKKAAQRDKHMRRMK